VLFSKLATRRNCAATCDPRHLCVCAPCQRRARLDLACRRPGAASVHVRPRASLCGRPTSRRRSRSSERQPRARPGRGNRVVRGDGADRWEDSVDRDTVRLHRNARPSRVDRRGARGARRRRLGRRDGRAERGGRLGGPLRVFRCTHDERSTGVRRSPQLVASARRASAVPGHRARRQRVQRRLGRDRGPRSRDRCHTRRRSRSDPCLGGGEACDCFVKVRGDFCGGDGSGHANGGARRDPPGHNRHRGRTCRCSGRGGCGRGPASAAHRGRAVGSRNCVPPQQGHSRESRVFAAGVRRCKHRADAG